MTLNTYHFAATIGTDRPILIPLPVAIERALRMTEYLTTWVMETALQRPWQAVLYNGKGQRVIGCYVGGPNGEPNA